VATEEQQQEEQENQESEQGNRGTAVKAAAAAAATGVAAFAARKALSGHGGSDGGSNGSRSPLKRGQDDSVLSSALSGGWEAAREALIPAAEDAAGAVGEFLAENGPEVIRERIVPRFIDSFNRARGGG
jgi:hypothetical protein